MSLCVGIRIEPVFGVEINASLFQDKKYSLDLLPVRVPNVLADDGVSAFANFPNMICVSLSRACNIAFSTSADLDSTFVLWARVALVESK